MNGKLLTDKQKQERMQAWLDSLCDKHAAEKCECGHKTYACWRSSHPEGLGSNRGICPECGDVDKPHKPTDAELADVFDPSHNFGGGNGVKL